MKEPTKIFLTKGQILDLACLLSTDYDCKKFDTDYIFELQYVDEVGLEPEIKCLASYCDNYDLIWNNRMMWWESIQS